MLRRTGRLAASGWRRSAASHAAGARLEFPGGEPEAPHVKTPIPGPKSLEMQKQLSTMQDAAGVKFFGPCRAVQSRHASSHRCQRPSVSLLSSHCAARSVAMPLLPASHTQPRLQPSSPPHSSSTRSGLRGQPWQLRGGRGRQHAAGHVLSHCFASPGLQQPAYAGRLPGALRSPRASPLPAGRRPLTRPPAQDKDNLPLLAHRPALGNAPPVGWPQRVAKTLLAAAPPGLHHVVPMMCGSCANENAFKAVFMVRPRRAAPRRAVPAPLTPP